MVEKNIFLEITRINVENKINNEEVLRDFEYDINSFIPKNFTLVHSGIKLENLSRESSKRKDKDFNVYGFFKNKDSQSDEEDEDDVESLCANTEDNVDSDIELDKLDNFLQNQNKKSVEEKNEDKRKYFNYFLELSNKSIMKNNNQTQKDIEDKNDYEENTNQIDYQDFEFEKESTESTPTTAKLYIKIHELEFENKILKNEVRELKDKMQTFEIFMMNFQTSAMSPCNSNTDIYNMNQYDKFKTMLKDTQYELKKMKDQMEYMEALQSEQNDKIEVLETLVECSKDS